MGRATLRFTEPRANHGRLVVRGRTAPRGGSRPRAPTTSNSRGRWKSPGPVAWFVSKSPTESGVGLRRTFPSRTSTSFRSGGAPEPGGCRSASSSDGTPTSVPGPVGSSGAWRADVSGIGNRSGRRSLGRSVRTSGRGPARAFPALPLPCGSWSIFRGRFRRRYLTIRASTRSVSSTPFRSRARSVPGAKPSRSPGSRLADFRRPWRSASASRPRCGRVPGNFPGGRRWARPPRAAGPPGTGPAGIARRRCPETLKFTASS